MDERINIFCFVIIKEKRYCFGLESIVSFLSLGLNFLFLLEGGGLVWKSGGWVIR